MATQVIERTQHIISALGGSPTARRDLKTKIWHADEPAYKEELKAKGLEKEDMWQGGDIFYPNPPKMSVDKIVEDVSGRESQFSLDKNGFMYAKQHSKTMRTREDLLNKQKIEKEYYPEIEQWLKEVTGAPRALVIHHGCRISDSKVSVNGLKREELAKMVIPQPAVHAAHLDQSSWQGGNVLHNHFPDECENLMHGRYMIVNAWRPIKTVHKDPFGVADASTVPSSDLVVRANRWFKEIRESMGLIPNEAHKWYYMYEQKAEDVLIFKQYDNWGSARACPHTAFVDEEFLDSEPRESIEIRAILLWPESPQVRS